MFRRLIPVFFLATAPLMFGANKDMIELQRDVAQLQDQVRQLQQQLVEKTTNLQALMQQVIDNTTRSGRDVAVIQSNLRDSLKQQQDSVAAPVAGVGAKLDQMGEDFRALKEAILDMNSRMGKLDAKIADLQRTIDVVHNPPTAPPPTGGGSASMGGNNQLQYSGPGGGIAAGSMPANTPPPAGMSAETTYSDAYRDYSTGKYDLAMQEFGDYVKYFPTTQFAPNAQFYLGDIYYRKRDYPNAVVAFDAVLEHYSDNSKTPDAHYLKGMSLLQTGKRDAAAKEFREVASRYPDSPLAAKAKQELRNLGLSTTPATARARRR